jgi:hypothetical protein
MEGSSHLWDFGNWLQAENSEFQPSIDLADLRASNMVKCSKNLEVEVVDGVLNGESLGSHD